MILRHTHMRDAIGLEERYGVGSVRDDTTRQRELRETRRLFTEVGVTGHAERLAKELS